VAAAELKDGGDNSDEEEIEGSSKSLSEDSTDGDEGKSGAEDKWVDEDGDKNGAASSQPKKSKGRPKVFSCVEKVRKVPTLNID
jgi:hypothetical protein